MAFPQKLHIKWTGFQDNVSGSLGTVQEDGDFSDVTLVCDDDQQIKAHKVILAASSSVFKSMLKRTGHPHPLIFLRGVTAKDLASVMDFIYRGEVTVSQEDLQDFLSTAEDLQVTGVKHSVKEEMFDETVKTESNKAEQGKRGANIEVTEDRSELINPSENQLFDCSECPQSSESNSDLKEHLLTHYSSGESRQTSVTVDTGVLESSIEDNVTVKEEATNPGADQSKEDKKAFGNIAMYIVPHMEHSDYNMTVLSLVESTDEGGRKWSCKMCGKVSRHKGHIREHVECHIDGLTFSCAECDAVTKSRHQMKRHVYTHRASFVNVVNA